MHNRATNAVDQFLRFNRTLVIETREFRDLKHNEDLCPRFQAQLESILSAVGLYEPIVYDTQGILDHGADVVVRIRDERRGAEEPSELIGLQIKSYDDFRSKDLFQLLKAQRDDAFRKIKGLSSYYIVLCTDEARDKNTIRNIEAEFKSADRTTVIEPTYALNFIRMTHRKIEGIVTRLEQADDFVFRKALNAVMLGSPTASILAVFLATTISERGAGVIGDIQSLQQEDALEQLYEATLVARTQAAERYKEIIEFDDAGPFDPRAKPSEEDLQRMSEDFYNTFEEALAYDIDLLDGDLIEVDSTSGEITVRMDEMLPIVALLTEGMPH